MHQGQIKSFTQLEAWRKGHQLVILVYKLTQNFPKAEFFGLALQIRRAVVSITSNIAEGFSRNSYKEKIQFYFIALGSLTEVKNQLLIARDLSFLTKEDFNNLASLTIELSKIINGLIKKSKTLIPNS